MRDSTHYSNTALLPIGSTNDKNKLSTSLSRVSCAAPQKNTISHADTAFFFSQKAVVFVNFSGLSVILAIPTGTIVGAALKLVANRSFNNNHFSFVALIPFACDRTGFSALVAELNKLHYRVDASKVADVMRVLGV